MISSLSNGTPSFIFDLCVNLATLASYNSQIYVYIRNDFINSNVTNLYLKHKWNESFFDTQASGFYYLIWIKKYRRGDSLLLPALITNSSRVSIMGMGASDDLKQFGFYAMRKTNQRIYDVLSTYHRDQLLLSSIAHSNTKVSPKTMLYPSTEPRRFLAS